MRTQPEPSDEWPRGCRGSRRPWVVFIGPSPGGKDRRDEEAEPVWNKPFTAPFRWGRGFTKSMKTLLDNLMPEAPETDRAFLYAVYNFDSVENSRASQVPIESMKKGAPRLLSLLEESPPRLIVPMEKRCFEELRCILLQHRYDLAMINEPIAIPIYDNPKGAQKFHESLIGCRIAGNGPLNGSIVVRLPQHPAHIFSAAYAERCAKAVRGLFERLPAPTT
jgi:hypothetical protein